MEYDFSLVFCDPNNHNDEYVVHFELLNRHISIKWYKNLRNILMQSSGWSNERFNNFLTSDWNEEKFASEIQKVIDIINQEHDGYIDYKVNEKLTQEDHNILHTYFEKLRGPTLEPHHHFEISTPECKKAIEDLNVLIHKWESYVTNRAKGEPSRFVTINFEQQVREQFEDEDYQYCDYPKRFGELCISYCEVGKSLYHVFNDQDEAVGDEYISPLRRFCADFDLHFNMVVDDEQKVGWRARFDEWWDRKGNFLTSLGFVKDDPKNAIGKITVAQIVSDQTNQQIIDEIEKRQYLKRIELEW